MANPMETTATPTTATDSSPVPMGLRTKGTVQITWCLTRQQIDVNTTQTAFQVLQKTNNVFKYIINLSL